MIVLTRIHKFSERPIAEGFELKTKIGRYGSKFARERHDIGKSLYSPLTHPPCSKTSKEGIKSFRSPHRTSTLAGERTAFLPSVAFKVRLAFFLSFATRPTFSCAKTVRILRIVSLPAPSVLHRFTTLRLATSLQLSHSRRLSVVTERVLKWLAIKGLRRKLCLAQRTRHRSSGHSRPEVPSQPRRARSEPSKQADPQNPA